jgi:hypothetical protein
MKKSKKQTYHFKSIKDFSPKYALSHHTTYKQTEGGETVPLIRLPVQLLENTEEEEELQFSGKIFGGLRQQTHRVFSKKKFTIRKRKM